MEIIRPYTTLELSCEGCGDECQVVIWNGVGNWSMVPAIEIMAQEECLVTVLKVSPLATESMAAWTLDMGPHVADRVLVWCKDENTYDVMVKLLTNPELVHRPEEGDDGKHTSH